MSYKGLITLVFNPYTGQSAIAITSCPHTRQSEGNNLDAVLLEKRSPVD